MGSSRHWSCPCASLANPSPDTNLPTPWTGLQITCARHSSSRPPTASPTRVLPVRLRRDAHRAPPRRPSQPPGPTRRCKGNGVIQRLRHMSSAPRRLVHASLVVLIGLGAAVVAYAADMGESHLFDWKFGFCAGDWTATKALCCSGYSDCPNWRTWSQIAHVSDAKFSGFNFAIYLTSGLLLALMSHVVTISAPARPSWYRDGDGNGRREDTTRLDRAAAGSGVSDVKQAVLVGSVTFGGDSTPWTARTLVLKTIGLVLSTSSGLSVGKEGPYVHLSAAAANLLGSWPGVWAGTRMPTRKVLCIGAAAGMAAAFGTPVAGLVFVIEDFGQSLTAGIVAPLLGGGVVAVVALTGLGPYGTGRAVPWDVRYPPRATSWWTSGELALFVVVGAAAGVLGARFIMAVRSWSRQWRRLPLVLQHPALDVSLVAVATACSTFWNQDLRCGIAELLSRLAESAATEGEVAAAWDLVPLGVGLLVRFALTVMAFGLEVPQGIYMPSMAMGAMLGRFIGHAGLAVAGPTMFATHPAVYAMAGAGAVMAATTHLQLTIMALVFETTRSWEYILPMAVSICTAKAVAARLEPRSIYQLAACLQDRRPLETLLGSSSIQVKDVWEPRSAEGAAPLSLQLGPSFAPEPVYGLRRLLSASLTRGASHVPVLKDGQRLVGCVSVQSVCEALQPLPDSARVVLYHVAVSETLCIRAVGADAEAGNNDDDDDQHALVARHVDLALQQPAVFASCSTLSSIHAYLSRSDADFVCVTERGAWAVVTRQVLAAWALSGQ
ncbi:Clc chloride channel [Coniochaeta ligniaria NRRL 30616]|uniref:Clc chloride channel n=1 Tax=Coniochaeta ligniaria NRRL 30616 TaxID=1408157 RepID=A0A1J7IUA5_9PEZI|nr:Clc chloride channel [Coniochaeta ligniaria NRRL 30616]